MPQKLPVKKFKLIEDASQFNENFRKIYNEESDEGPILKVDVQYHEKYMNLIMIYLFTRKNESYKI